MYNDRSDSVEYIIKTTHYIITGQKKNTIHQLTTMLATCKNAKFPGHNHLLTTSTNDPTL